jgi:hypothetical protein
MSAVPRAALWVGPPGQGGNYVGKLLALAASLAGAPGPHIVDVAHDGGCLIWRLGYCSCNPTVTLREDGAA